MALTATNFDTRVVENVLLQDFRRDSVVFREFSGSAEAQDLLRRATDKEGGGFHKSLIIPRLNQPAAMDPVDGYTVATYPGAEDLDLSSSYPVLTDDQATIDFNKLYMDTFRIPDIHRDAHAAGALLQNARVRAAAQNIYDDVEESFLLEMLNHARPASVAAGVATRFALDTTSQAALAQDLGVLMGDAAKQNVPEGERKLLVLNSAVKGSILQWTNLLDKDIQSAGNADFATGTIKMAMGLELVFTNSMSSDSGLLIVPSRAALVNPLGIEVEVLRDINTKSDYCRVSAVMGFAPLGKVVTAGDGDAWSIAREGICSVSVS